MNLSEHITFPHLLICIPLIAGLMVFFAGKDSVAKACALLAALLTLAVSISSLFYKDNANLNGTAYTYEWLKYLGSSFSVTLDGMGRLLTFLTAVAFPVIFIATYKNTYKSANAFYGLMLLTQAGLMGVFTANDAMLFYFFWELALVPVYFLCSRWGGERRIQATFKFFVYTFAGSLLMLTGIIFIYLHTSPTTNLAHEIVSDHSFSWQAFASARLEASDQNWLFWLFFIAFAIKMPIFPFHTWQPDAYEQSPAPATMVLSGIMVKMGLFGVIKWLLPVLPLASAKYSSIAIVLSVTGMIYASCIAIVQDSLKRLVAYSSIAHIGLMCAAVFSKSEIGMQGVMVQMFNHGINIIGLWIVIELIEKQLGVKKISELGGVAHKAPVLTILLVIIALANIALPLTNAFVGEFMMFTGLYHFNGWITAIAGLSIILAAVYTLNMIKNVFLGEANPVTSMIKDISLNEKLILIVVVLFIFVIGVYPQPMLDMAKDTVKVIMSKW
ncbi:MAG: NADH-quinone oxidoreductase subunit M [Ferruginibacter sp.]